MLYTSIFLAIVFLWSINRQFHFKHRHSYDTEPLKPLQKARKTIKNAAKRISRNKPLRTGEHDEGPDNNLEEMKLEEQRNLKSFQTFLEDFEDDDEEPTVNDTSKRSFSQRSNTNDAVSSTESRKDSHRTKDLLHVASKIEVFSYLSPEAVADILKYVEYIDFKNIGDVLYDQETLDGSMYAVIQGEVTTHLSVTNKIEGMSIDRQSEMNKGFSIVAGPGEVVTSMLTLVTSLVHEYIREKGDDDDGNESLGDNPQMIPYGIEIRAIISSKNTRLLRIPPRCFVTILNKFPKDVHIICQTIIARLQRVTIQTLVRFLGIDVGILGNLNTLSRGNIPTQDFNLHLRSGASSELTLAIQFAASLLELPAEHSHELEKGASIIRISPGSFLCHKGEVTDAVYLILDGYLDVEKTDVTLKDNTNNDEGETDAHIKANRTKNFLLARDGVDSQNNHFEPSFRVERGAWIGLFSSFTNEASFVTTRAPMSEKNSTILLKVPLSTFESIVSRFPSVLIKVLSGIIETISNSYTDCLSSSIFLLDLGLDWMHVEAGQYIASQGERCDSIFVVLNGRLRTKISKDDSRNQSKQEEFGRGATIGELEALSESQWTYSVYAVRHCEVARIPLSLFNIIMTLSPGAGIHFAKVIASQIYSRKKSSRLSSTLPSILPSYALSLATVAVVPMTADLDICGFCSYFRDAMNSIAPCKLLTKEDTKKKVGEEFFRVRNNMLKVKMTRVLGDLEENNRLVIYQSDYNYTWWTKLCIQQADCVLLLVSSAEVSELMRVEACLRWASEVKNVRIEMVVVKTTANDSCCSHCLGSGKNVNQWSEKRPWISKHHIVRHPFAEYKVDFCRVSRRITNQSVGLVLGGGGARGLGHLGVIKALQEAGIPIDMVGGTSQGAFIGALLARAPDDYDHMLECAREMASDMSSVSNKIKDLTLPLTSFFSGHHFNRGIKKILKAEHIQDFVLNFFCVSVDIRNSCQVVHTKGLAWKFVRASMSLTGYLPPISENKMLLVDGGYMNIVPADVMVDMGAKKVIAVDVSSEMTRDFFEYGTELSGLWLLWNSWNPFVQTVKVPSMGDINERLSWISSERTKKDVIDNKVDLFLKPPVDHFGTLDYDKFDEIVDIGYKYAKPKVKAWAEANGFKAPPSI